MWQERSNWLFIRFEKYSNIASETYEKALKLATDNLEPCSPLKLGIELNMSVFHYEIKNDTKKAIFIAHKTYIKIEEQLHHLQSMQNKGDEYNDAATIMQLLYENLNMWRNELQEENAGKDEKGEY